MSSDSEIKQALAGLPQATGQHCPDHPTFEVVDKPGEGYWCRRGQHFLQTTISGRSLTVELIERLSEEAEAGYDPAQLRPRPRD